MKKTGKLLSALLVVSLAVGCSSRQVLTTLGLGAAAGGAVAAVLYVKGDLEADVAHDTDRTYKAALSAMEERNYQVTEKNMNDTSGEIKASIPAYGGEKERDLTIKLERKDEMTTNVSIRVGIFGDEALSRAILDDIRANLR